MRKLTYILFVLATMSTSSIVWAQQADPEDKLRAEDALKAANEAAAKSNFSVAVPKYREVLKLGDGAHPLAYYNLAEVQKVRGKCQEAVKVYQLYAHVVGTDEAKKEAAAGVAKCKGTAWPTLHVVAEPSSEARIYIDGVFAARGEFGPAALPAGTYDVRVEAVDHHPRMRTVELKEQKEADAEGPDAKVELKLEEMTFFGTILIKTDVKGARVRIFEGASDETKQLYDLRTPMKEGAKVQEGRHFVEVTAEGYDRWIRNVSVGRDDEAVVDVQLTKSLPPELK